MQKHLNSLLKLQSCLDLFSKSAVCWQLGERSGPQELVVSFSIMVLIAEQVYTAVCFVLSPSCLSASMTELMFVYWDEPETKRDPLSLCAMLFSARAETRRGALGYCMSFEKMVWWNHTQIRKFTISCFMFFAQQHSKPPTKIDLGYIMIKKATLEGKKKKRDRSSKKTHHNQKTLPASI